LASKRNRLKDIESIRKLRDTRRAAKLCVNCGNSVFDDKIRCVKCRTIANAATKNREQQLKKEVLDHYGAPYCQCCNQYFDYVFLQLDHIDGNGAEQRKALNIDTGKSTYSWLRRNNFPPGFQTLCANCNWGKRNKAECPCKAKQKEMFTNLSKLPLTY
jgi:hypothetical protein